MAKHLIKHLRTIALVGQAGSGKTSLAEEIGPPTRSFITIWPHICAVWKRVQYIAGALARTPSSSLPISWATT